MAYADQHQTAVVQRHPAPPATGATRSSSVADILERVLDKGIVITGDIKINLTNVELLTIQIRLVICSVDRAMEMGLDWWTTNPNFSSRARQSMPAERPAALHAGSDSAQPNAQRQRMGEEEFAGRPGSV